MKLLVVLIILCLTLLVKSNLITSSSNPKFVYTKYYEYGTKCSGDVIAQSYDKTSFCENDLTLTCSDSEEEIIVSLYNTTDSSCSGNIIFSSKYSYGECIEEYEMSASCINKNDIELPSHNSFISIISPSPTCDWKNDFDQIGIKSLSACFNTTTTFTSFSCNSTTLLENIYSPDSQSPCQGTPISSVPYVFSKCQEIQNNLNVNYICN